MGRPWQGAIAVTMSLGLLAGAVASATAQATPPVRDERSVRKNITGTVKKIATDGVVIEELKRDGTNGKEWAFAVQADTRTRAAKGAQAIEATDLRAGDRVAITFTERDGKVVAETITKLDGVKQ